MIRNNIEDIRDLIGCMNELDVREDIMGKYIRKFIEFMVDCGVLKFGDFVTKSGRNTPFLSIGYYRPLTASQIR